MPLVRSFGGRCWHVVDDGCLGGDSVIAECLRDFTGAQLEHGGVGVRPICEQCRRRLWINFLGRIQPRA